MHRVFLEVLANVVLSVQQSKDEQMYLTSSKHYN
jgi:hypothetical protein